MNTNDKSKLKPSLGKTKGPTRHSRWTFWQWGIGKFKKLYCEICKKRAYKVTRREDGKFVGDCCKNA